MQTTCLCLKMAWIGKTRFLPLITTLIHAVNSTMGWIFQINFLVQNGVIEPMCSLLEVKDTKVLSPG